MAETKKVDVSTDPWKSPKDTWQYVTVPEEDATGLKHPPITLNKIAFNAGQTYHVPIDVALFVKDRLKAYNKSVIRLFNPKADLEAIRAVPAGSAPGGQITYVDASKISTM